MKYLTTLASDFYEQVFKYINGQSDLERFEHWLVTNLNELLSLSSIDTIELVNLIELNRAEMSEGHRTEEVFKEEIRNYLRTHSTIEAEFGNNISVATSSSSTTNSQPPGTIEEQAHQFSYTRL